jgi:hypothetical protein
MACNQGITRDHNGLSPDWMEVHNATDSAMDLAGLLLCLGDSPTDQWRFPAGTSIPARGYIVVWWDGSRPASGPDEVEFNTGRSLPREGASLYLRRPSGERIDSVIYGPQVANASIGRAHDRWQLLEYPTPAAANATPASLGSIDQLKLNEWMSSASGEEDWFELYNADSRPVELAGLFLSDDPSIAGQTKFRIGPLSFVAAHGWVRWMADDQVRKGSDHVNFRLDQEGESLRLYRATGEVIDQVDYGPQTAGVSEGRFPDGATVLGRFPDLATPGGANGTLPLPRILVQPANQRVPLGAEASFAVTVASDLPFSCLWFHEGNPLATGTNTLLRIAGVTAADAGAYRVVITSSAGMVTSLEVLLRIAAPLTLSFAPGLAEGEFRLQILGTPGARQILQMSSDLVHWSCLTTNETVEGISEFTDAWSTNAPWRFYRAVEDSGQ